MTTVLRFRASLLFVALVTACSADPIAILPELRGLELSHLTRAVTIHEQISVEVRAVGSSFLRVAPPALEWTSSDPVVASVDQNGLITGHRLGRVLITATGGGKRASIAITVRAAAVNVTVQSGLPDLLVGERTILDAQLVDANGLPAAGDGSIVWATADTGVVRLQAIPGNQNRLEIIAQSPGLARVTAGSEGVLGGFFVAVLTDRTVNPPIKSSDFHIVKVIDAANALWLQPSLRVGIDPGRVVDVLRIDVALLNGQPSYPALCSNTRLQSGSHELLGFGSYPVNANLYVHSYQPSFRPHGVALLTYRENGITRTVLLRETENAWDYDFVYQPAVPWQPC
jgi:hypothetical protein